MKLKLLNGNDQFYTTTEDLTICITSKVNEVALKGWEKETGLKFERKGWLDHWYAYPKSAIQIVKLLTNGSTYAFKVSYSDNLTSKNILFLEVVER